jgi:hypothetical protein
MHFKNHEKGSILIEALLALALIGLVVTPMMMQQSSVLDRVHRISLRLEHIYAAEQFWYEMQHKMMPTTTSFSEEKKLDDGTVLTFTRGPIDAKSALAKYQHIVQDKVVIAWQAFEQPMREQIVYYAHIMVPEESAQ